MISFAFFRESTDRENLFSPSKISDTTTLQSTSTSEKTQEKQESKQKEENIKEKTAKQQQEETKKQHEAIQKLKIELQAKKETEIASLEKICKEKQENLSKMESELQQNKKKWEEDKHEFLANAERLALDRLEHLNLATNKLYAFECLWNEKLMPNMETFEELYAAMMDLKKIQETFKSNNKTSNSEEEIAIFEKISSFFEKNQKNFNIPDEIIPKIKQIMRGNASNSFNSVQNLNNLRKEFVNNKLDRSGVQWILSNSFLDARGVLGWLFVHIWVPMMRAEPNLLDPNDNQDYFHEISEIEKKQNPFDQKKEKDSFFGRRKQRISKFLGASTSRSRTMNQDYKQGMKFYDKKMLELQNLERILFHSNANSIEISKKVEHFLKDGNLQSYKNDNHYQKMRIWANEVKKCAEFEELLKMGEGLIELEMISRKNQLSTKFSTSLIEEKKQQVDENVKK